MINLCMNLANRERDSASDPFRVGASRPEGMGNSQAGWRKRGLKRLKKGNYSEMGRRG